VGVSWRKVADQMVLAETLRTLRNTRTREVVEIVSFKTTLQSFQTVQFLKFKFAGLVDYVYKFLLDRIELV
jgi:hypothetical protein